MFKLPIRTWILNAAAVVSGRRGDVSRQAQQAGCSRQTVYQHARKVLNRVADAPPDSPPVPDRPVPDRPAPDRPAPVAAPPGAAAPRGDAEDDRLKKMVATAVAMGLSLRQIEELLAILLPADKAPDHATLGRWVQADARRAGQVLAVLDRACATRVSTLALDEIFFGGGRPWLDASRRA